MLEEGIQESQRGIVHSSVDPELRLPQGAARLPRPAEHSLHVDGGYGERGPVVFPTYLHCLFLGPKVVCWMGYSVHLFKTTCMIVHTSTSHVVSLETPTRSMVLGVVVAPHQYINFPSNTPIIRWHRLFVLLSKGMKRRNKPNPIQYPLHPLHSTSCAY